jgi:N4-gp56 family major capsid protein
MSNSTVASANVVTKYEKEVTAEYIRNNRFSKYMGTTENSIIRIREGKQIISFPLIPRLTAAGVSGAQTLRGSGEQLRNYAWTTTPTYFRNACEFTKEELDKPAFDMLAEAKPRLSGWAKEKVRDDVITAMGAIYDGTTYSSYASAAEAAKDAWLVNNADRVLFGAAKSNASSNDHSTSLGNVDSTNDVLKGAAVSLMKRMAKLADPHITPFRTMDDDQEWYVLFCGSYCFRDLKSDLSTVHQNAAPRDMKGNPIWTDGDLVYDGVIVREVPEIASITGVGASSIDVAPAFLCGAEAVSFGLGQRPTIKVDNEYDFGFNPGVAVELKHQIRKTFFNAIQHGMVTGYFASVAD